MTRQRPVLVLEAIKVRQDLCIHELVRGPCDQPVFVRQLLGCEDALSRGLFEEPRAPFGWCCCGGCHRRSKMPAAPIPPPTHMLTRPYRAFRRRISYNSVVVSFAPVQPSGCPNAMAPPLTFSLSGSIGSSRRHASTCAANASFNSTRSIWSSVIPA